MNHVVAEVRAGLGVLALDRPAALNALSLDMIRALDAALRAWADDAAVRAVLLRGTHRPGKSPAFCAGGDIRFFHQAVFAGDPRLEDFFSEEYTLDHFVHRYPKPVVVLMEGICMGGGMGLAQGASVRVVTEHSRIAMPETQIGLFPDVGGGWFLARCPGHTGEWLALTGQQVGADDALALGLADVKLPAAALDTLADAGGDIVSRALALAVAPEGSRLARAAIDRHFAAPTLPALFASLAADASDFARETLAALHKRSPLMLAVTLEQVRRARELPLDGALRMERGMVRHAFHLRPAAASETVEGIRALAIDKDHAPRWNPASVDAVTPEQVQAFFDSPWPAAVHPLRDLRGDGRARA